LVKAPVAILYY